MTLRVYNSLSRKKEVFEPIQEGKVNMYVCGPTVYDSCHIGHARNVIVFDVIARYLKAKGYQATYVRNFTDIDDKIINRANELEMDPQSLAEKYIEEFYNDMDALNVERATFEPRATDHIQQIITVISKLFEKGMAYETNGEVFFSVEKFNDYGKLSGVKLEDMEAGARVDVNDKKQNPLDFVLWKPAKPGEPAWKSPWGKGRPGWHIECSAMSTTYLGETFDIHGGGKDLVFPHHENEIAQSEGAFGRPLANYWMHNGFVNINQEKMSKSLGNFLTIKDVLALYHPEAIRLFLLSNHYRSPIDFTEQAMIEATSGLDKIYALLDRVDNFVGIHTIVGETASGTYYDAFCEAMDDDFNTARGIGIIFEAVRDTNRLLDEHENGSQHPDLKHIVELTRLDLCRMGQILGLFREDPAAYFEKKRSKALVDENIDPAIINDLIRKRIEARQNKQWEKADRIRSELETMNVLLEDRPDGTIWKIKKP